MASSPRDTGVSMNESPLSDPNWLSQRILDYIKEHPEAADSLEGIASWWLSAPPHAPSLEAVQAALDLLVDQGRMARLQLADGRTLYKSADKISGSHPAWKSREPKP
jgi:Fe2+ or Zn2+ uptake regulation protein